MDPPRLSIDLHKIEHNARAIVGMCHERGIAVCGVTKGTCGSPEVARAMLRGGVTSLGDSRIANLRRLRDAGIAVPLVLLRIPPLSAVEDVVALADLSLNSELAVLRGLSAAARAKRRVHDVIVMVDLGDLREGVWPDDLVPFVREVLALPGVSLAGLGANLTCYGGVVPTEQNMGRLVRCAEEVEKTFGVRLRCLSGGNSSALPLIARGGMPARIDHVRIGEAILLGRETLHRRPWPGTYQDAFLLGAEVIEHKEKPSLPIGPRGEDAFGERRQFTDAGERVRVLVNVGREDVDVAGLVPVDPGMRVLGASSDTVILDVTDAATPAGVGDEIGFHLGYGALLATMTSGYVQKRFRGDTATA